MSSFGPPRIVLEEGTVVGVEEKLPNGNFYCTYKGIPYAEPPVGKLRFEDPIPLSKFSDHILDCTKERNVSHHKDTISSNFVGSEDCLHLNVYSPLSPQDSYNVNKPLAPVMVWVHGGGNFCGSGNREFYAPEYLVQENVVVVTLNYRLGLLGFLCLPEAGISGNAGLKDQLTALKWVNKNISKFGGDANNVTLFGECSGGGAVGLHILSDESRKYFHKAICQSGTALHEWSIEPDPEGKSMKIAELLGFKGSSQSEALDYLRNFQDLSAFYKIGIPSLNADERRRGLPLPFRPCIERKTSKAFLSKSPIELMKQKNLLNMPIMLGYNSGEGISTFLGSYKKLNLYDTDLARMIPRSLNVPNDVGNEVEAKEVAESISKFYFGGRLMSNLLLNEIADLQSDYHYIICMHLTAEVFSRMHPNSPLYFYRFSFDGTLNFYKKLAVAKLNISESLKGASHGDEMFYLFDSKYTEAERLKKSVSTRIADEMCKMWTNFAKYGDPTPVTDKSISVRWDRVKLPKDGEKFVLDYLNIDEKTQMLTDPDMKRMEFWRNLYQKWNGGFLNAKL